MKTESKLKWEMLESFPDGACEIVSDKNSIQWVVVSDNGEVFIKYTGPDYFKESVIGEKVNTGIFKSDSVNLNEAVGIIQNSYTDDIWEEIEG